MWRKWFWWSLPWCFRSSAAWPSCSWPALSEYFQDTHNLWKKYLIWNQLSPVLLIALRCVNSIMSCCRCSVRWIFPLLLALFSKNPIKAVYRARLLKLNMLQTETSTPWWTLAPHTSKPRNNYAKKNTPQHAHRSMDRSLPSRSWPPCHSCLVRDFYHRNRQSCWFHIVLQCVQYSLLTLNQRSSSIIGTLSHFDEWTRTLLLCYKMNFAVGMQDEGNSPFNSLEKFADMREKWYC